MTRSRLIVTGACCNNWTAFI